MGHGGVKGFAEERESVACAPLPDSAAGGPVNAFIDACCARSNAGSQLL